jgi:hypothetical protein
MLSCGKALSLSFYVVTLVRTVPPDSGAVSWTEVRRVTGIVRALASTVVMVANSKRGTQQFSSISCDRDLCLTSVLRAVCSDDRFWWGVAIATAAAAGAVIAYRTRKPRTPKDGGSVVEPLPEGDTSNGDGIGEPVPTILEYKPGGVQSAWCTHAKLAFAVPWRRFKKGSFLSIKLEGAGQPSRHGSTSHRFRAAPEAAWSTPMLQAAPQVHAILRQQRMQEPLQRRSSRSSRPTQACQGCVRACVWPRMTPVWLGSSCSWNP